MDRWAVMLRFRCCKNCLGDSCLDPLPPRKRSTFFPGGISVERTSVCGPGHESEEIHGRDGVDARHPDVGDIAATAGVAPTRHQEAVDRWPGGSMLLVGCGDFRLFFRPGFFAFFCNRFVWKKNHPEKACASACEKANTISVFK